MNNPNIKTKVVHSQTKSAWNVIGQSRGNKYKIARIPYTVFNNEDLGSRERAEALHHAEFISFCFNNSAQILNKPTPDKTPIAKGDSSTEPLIDKLKAFNNEIDRISFKRISENIGHILDNTKQNPKDYERFFFSSTAILNFAKEAYQPIPNNGATHNGIKDHPRPSQNGKETPR